MRHLECLHVCDGQAEVCQRTKFGLALDATPRPPLNCMIRPSWIAPLNVTFDHNCIGVFDLVVISEAAHWVGNDGALELEKCLASQGINDAANQSQAWIARLYGEQMQRNARFLANVSRSIRGTGQRQAGPRILFRTTTPGYPPPDVLPPDTADGKPPIYVRPARSTAWVKKVLALGAAPFNHHMIPQLNNLARTAFDHHAPAVGFMDLAHPMSYRVDGHLDMLHYCIPGPTDFVVAALHSFAM